MATSPQTLALFEQHRQVLQARYVAELKSLATRVADAVENAERRSLYSTHTPFNLSATCQDLQTLAAQIELTTQTITTLKEAL